MLGFVEKRNNLFIAAGLIAFPVVWLMLVMGQATYFGPMRSLFTKITRRYLDSLPFGWALFDVLFYLLPAVAFVLVALGLIVREDRKLSNLLIAGFVAVTIVLVIRGWSPGYL
jgi:hypothetical protein